MEQLLSIKRIPIKIEVNVTNFEYKRKEGTDAAPSVKVSQGDAGVVMAAEPYRVDVAAPRHDTYSAADMQGRGLTLTYDAVAKLPVSGDSSASGEGADIAARTSAKSIEAVLSRLPKSKNSCISYNDGTLSINYKVDKPPVFSNSASKEVLDLSSGFEFIPGRIEFVVSQMPGLEIEYLGDPLYFPRSADPNYKGEVDVIA